MQLPSLSRITAYFHLASLLLALGACADLLDIPGHPRLKQAVPGASGEAAPGAGPDTEQAPEPAGPPPNGEALNGELGSEGRVSEEEARLPPPLKAVGEADSEPGAASGEAPDAGPPAPDAAPLPVPVVPCADSGSVGPNDRCFVPVSALLSWTDARTNCLARGDGWDLAAIRDEATNEFLTSLAPGETWIGASDAEREGTWIWVSDGTPFWSGNGLEGSALNDAFENWNSDEPNGAGNSDCARLVRLGNAAANSPYTWADRECFEPRGSVCEGPR
jgi:hypothetical protein